ncbi:secreted frizzled-related protein 5 [Eurytemora carolleeae]|uniref:secreted frizzled-related protein 5 n=1 Tax=Eurytemora carolleeae TaxID=1294199 RepID=UPI000C759622|nr:secreted frizzled-related protein 5 [Eurytemora carolleeae]|eukprot:XP_023335381.1 secreted frizzled-related protein 5-like [Eurytemora affinis]
MKCLMMILVLSPLVRGYFGDWSLLTREREPTCVDIPSNMTLCQNIGYSKMRLPNLVEHDTLHEVSQQSMSWIPLLNIKCHPDTQLFLCSLFSPVCLERPIYPCRSLCSKVRSGCEEKMGAYGFPWPAMLDCAKFPQDNDMCITAQAAVDVKQEETCTGTSCDQHITAENILDNFCRADFVVKVKISKVRPRRLTGKKARVFRAWKGTKAELKSLRNPSFRFSESESCCTDRVQQDKKKRYLIMGRRGSFGRDFDPTFIVPWGKSKEFKRARRMFKEMNCDNLKETSQKMIVDTFAPSSLGNDGNPNRRSRRRSRTRRDRKRKPVSIWDGIIS